MAVRDFQYIQKSPTCLISRKEKNGASSLSAWVCLPCLACSTAIRRCFSVECRWTLLSDWAGCWFCRVELSFVQLAILLIENDEDSGELRLIQSLGERGFWSCHLGTALAWAGLQPTPGAVENRKNQISGHMAKKFIIFEERQKQKIVIK